MQSTLRHNVRLAISPELLPTLYGAAMYEETVQVLLTQISKTGCAPIWPTARVEERSFDGQLLIILSVFVTDRVS